MSDRDQVAAAYRVAVGYQKIADDHPVSGFAESFRQFAGDLRDALERAGKLRPTDLTAENMRAAILAIHTPQEWWTDSIVTDDGETQEALYDDAGELVYAPNIRTVCEGCGPQRDIPWPCPTARAVGVSKAAEEEPPEETTEEKP